MSAQKSKRHGRRRDKPYDDKRVKSVHRYDTPKLMPRMVRR